MTHEADRFDAIVVGGGHNGLVAAAYLARAGVRTVVLERLAEVGGAAVSAPIFGGHTALLSRYSYLVSLLPERIRRELGLRIELRSRPVASYTPVVRDGRHGGLLVESGAAGPAGSGTAESFRQLTGSDSEYAAWTSFYDRLGELARTVAPTLLEPLRGRAEFRRLIDPRTWREVFTEPLGNAVESAFKDDVVRGVVLTDALIGTFTHAADPTLRQNRCFLYHVIGDGTGEWRVPVGGMGAVTGELARVAREAGVEIRRGATVSAIDVDGRSAEVAYRTRDGEHRLGARVVLAGVAPAVLAALRDLPGGGPSAARPAGPAPEGSQLKVNLLLDRLPRLRSGVDPERAFAGTFHIDEQYDTLEAAYRAAADGRLPDPLPSEVYCHTLTDPSILGPGDGGAHTLTLFGLHTPARLFASDAASDAASVRETAVRRALAGLDRYLDEPITACLARDAEGNPCLEAHSPVDLEEELGLPGGHIFHNDLEWPFAEDDAADPVTDRWGVATDAANLFICGSGARRGGAVSGIPGHNAAMAALESPLLRFPSQ